MREEQDYQGDHEPRGRRGERESPEARGRQRGAYYESRGGNGGYDHEANRDGRPRNQGFADTIQMGRNAGWRADGMAWREGGGLSEAQGHEARDRWDEGHSHAHEHDRDYEQFRNDHVSKLDQDYTEFRNERRKKCADEFEKSRQERIKTGNESSQAAIAAKK